MSDKFEPTHWREGDIVTSKPVAALPPEQHRAAAALMRHGFYEDPESPDTTAWLREDARRVAEAAPMGEEAVMEALFDTGFWCADDAGNVMDEERAARRVAEEVCS